MAEVEGEQGPCFLGWGLAAYDVTVDLANIALRVAGALDGESSRTRSISIAHAQLLVLLVARELTVEQLERFRGPFAAVITGLTTEHVRRGGRSQHRD